MKHPISRYRPMLAAPVTGSHAYSVLAGCNTPSSTNWGNNQSSNQNGLQGTNLDGTLAPDFHLVDQHGHTISLAQLHGMPVIPTFFYTHCPNYCPLIAQKIHTALDTMGSDGQKVAVIGISVDPEHDTTANAQTFSEDHGLASY